MYFPKDMTFQYFFFDTYIGYFLQALPIALLVGIIYWFIKFRNDKTTPISKKVFSCIFVLYITGLVCLVVVLDLMNVIWYRLIYHSNSGTSINWFNGDFNFSLDFLNNISGETIGNFLMFLPFGILYPLSQKDLKWKNIILKGIVFVLIIEISQPIFGRAFDINDIILNSLGILVSTTIFIVIKNIIKKLRFNSYSNNDLENKENMKKIISIILILFLIIGLITNYVDGNRVSKGKKPRFCIDIVSEDGSKVTYWGLGYKVIRYVGVSPNEPFENSIGVKIGSWFMKYELREDLDNNC